MSVVQTFWLSFFVGLLVSTVLSELFKAWLRKRRLREAESPMAKVVEMRKKWNDK